METLCFVLGNAFPLMKGGAELQAYNLAKGFVKKGYDVHYIHQNKEDVKEELGGIHWHRLPNRPRKFSQNILNYPSLRSTLNKIKPDVIYQRVKNPYTGMVGYYCKHKKCIFVWGASSERDCLRKFKGDRKRWLMQFFNWKLGAYGIKRADAVVAQTERQKQMLNENFGLDAEVIPNGQYVPNKSHNKVSPPLVIWVANMKQLKRPEYFIRLARKCRDIDAEFLMVGRRNWNKRYQNKLDEMISKLDNLRYIGEVSYDEVNALIEKASILVNTSVSEGLPNTYIQAWMRETPVVTISFDPDDVISNKGLGIKADGFDGLAKGVSTLINDDELRVEMGKRAREYAVSTYDIDKIIQKYEALFKSLLL